MTTWLRSATLMLAVCSLVRPPALAAEPAEPDDAEGLALFEKKIRPVLVERCYECHSAGAKKVEGSLLLDSREASRQGGDLGPAVVPGQPDESLLMQAIRYGDENLQMPPKARLSAEVIADFEAWIKRGAPDPRDGSAPAPYVVDIESAKLRWPYTPPSDPPIPAVKNEAWPRGAIDRFILARLEAEGLAPASDADKRTLLRRVTYDLIGLPPTPEETAAFLADESEGAFAALVERLLDSPRYGERWGRHWLDVVRYADTAGDNSDYPIPQLYRYRNWVIDAFNADLPYDEFVRQQLAGDLLPAQSLAQKQRQTIATGYIASARRFGSRVDDYPQHLTIEDTIDNLGRSLLAHSLNCARCHNHKFDPLTADDYYAIYGIFHSTRYPWPGIELDKKQHDLIPLGEDAVVVPALELRWQQEAVFAQEIAAANERKKAAQKLVETQQQRVEKLKQDGAPAEGELKTAEDQLAAEKQKLKDVEELLKAAKKKKEDFERSPLPFELAYAVAEGKKIENVKVQLKGDPQRLGPEVPRRVPQVFGGQALAADSPASGRLELAQWIASPDNPLTARVLVNRLWHHHFGRGIVATPNDFGKQGKPPTHPELLDWLALRFVENGWSIKSMHRLLVLSRTYQLASGEGFAADPANQLLSHYPRRRLDAESIRDTLLVLGGNLDPTPGGEHPFPPPKDWDFTQHKPFKAVYETNRRSVYLMTQRISRHPFLAIFDGPDTGASTANRVTSTTPLQALFFLNDPLVHEQARLLAARLCQAKETDEQRLQLAYELLFTRPPTDDERSLGQAHLKQFEESAAGWESYVRVLLRTNELVYLQ